VRSAEELIDCIVNSSRIPAGKRRREIQRELRCHIEDFVVAARKAGHDQDEIEKQVLANFGDPEQIIEGFAWVYRYERRRLRALAFMLSTMLLACGVSAAVLATQAVLALSLGTPIMSVFASTHTVIEALDILASVAVYLGVISLEGVFDSHRFQKAASLLAAILTLLMMLCAAAGLHVTFPVYGLVTGIFFRAMQLFVAPKLVRTGIVVVCFALAGVVSALRWSPDSPVAVASTCASWLVLGACYQLMTHLAARVDAVLLTSLQRIQEGY
jgi:hypothetical protein